MKRISILSALLLMCAMTFAQQALWGGAPVSHLRYTTTIQ